MLWEKLPGTVPGDVVFVLACNKHKTFLRKSDDLLYQTKIPLSQALTGLGFRV
jgi:DnaJ-class molecular chaperone